MGDKPVMCEYFGARPYSSEMACVSEVESSAIYLLILGEKYGYIGPNGESITQMEFHTAKAAGKQILTFIQDGPKEEQQDDFCKEVEHFANGFFRETFRTSEDLKDSIVKSLRQLDHAQLALPKDKLSSISYRMQGDSEAALNKHFIPFTKDAYLAWIEQCLKRFERIFTS